MKLLGQCTPGRSGTACCMTYSTENVDVNAPSGRLCKPRTKWWRSVREGRKHGENPTGRGFFCKFNVNERALEQESLQGGWNLLKRMMLWENFNFQKLNQVISLSTGKDSNVSQSAYIIMIINSIYGHHNRLCLQQGVPFFLLPEAHQTFENPL